jgi:hypothetical protein
MHIDSIICNNFGLSTGNNFFKVEASKAMRELFISERRFIRNVLSKQSQDYVEMSGPVVVEYYAPPRKRSPLRFNNDFSLQFVPSEQLANFKSFGAAILPNTVGVDVFVTVDEETSQLLMAELLGGEAFSARFFKEHIEKIESRLTQLSCPIELRRASYCRIFVIENEICFLAFPNEPMPVVRGKTELLSADAESSIACSRDREGIVYLDGWIRACVSDSDRKLEAIACDVDGSK